MYRDDLRAAERLLLEYAPETTISTSSLFDLVESGRSVSPDTVRHAYWTLVERGLLERLPEGVRRAPGALSVDLG